MNGLEISRTFFFDWGLPYLQQQIPSAADRVAAVLIQGSQIYGADDEISRDHGWGPLFLLVASEADFAAFGASLQQALASDAPREWAGYEFKSPIANAGVTSIDRFFRHMAGFARPPANPLLWLDTYQSVANGSKEHALYLIRHGHVFYDPEGSFSARRASFKYYPRIAWLQRIWEETYNVWQYGQYNFLERLAYRDDPMAQQMAQVFFCEAVMRLCLLLEKDYTPYWKWLAFEFRKCSRAETPGLLLDELATGCALARRIELIENICDSIHTMLASTGCTEGEWNQEQATPQWSTHTLYQDQRQLAALLQHEVGQLEAGAGANKNQPQGERV